MVKKSMKKLVLIACAIFATAPLFAGLEAWTTQQIEIRNAKTVGVGTVTDHQSLSEFRSFTDGAIAAYPQADIVWHDERSLASGASETLDLYGTLTDAFGATVNLLGVRALFVQNTGTTTITIAGDAAAPASLFFQVATSGITLPASATMMINVPISGMAVTSGTADLLKVTNSSGGTGTYKIMILGTSQ